MNHTNVAIVGILAVAAALIGAVGISISIQQQSAAAQNDVANSETNFEFKQKLSNNCSGFTSCSNNATETFGGVGLPLPTPVG
jgi:hypothetical protein